MMDYNKICANCVEGANDICRAWENLYQRSLNYGEPITSPYDVITLDDIDGGYKEINDICKDVIRFEYTLSPRWVMINFYGFVHNTDWLIRAFCNIIGEPYDIKYISYDKQTFWKLEPISGKYAFTLLEIWWVVSEYDKWLEKCESRENVCLVVKSWYNSIYRDKINLLHWLMWFEGVLDTTK